MSRADDEGFLAEYVYTAYGRGHWTEPNGLDLQTWPDWANSNLNVHDPVLDPGIAVEWNADKLDDSNLAGYSSACRANFSSGDNTMRCRA